MTSTDRTGPARAAAANGGLGYLASVSVFYATCLVILLGDLADGKLYHGDVDNEMRALQIGHLLSGKAGWFDLSLPFVQMPEIYVSPWSRLVDLPYVLLARGFELAMPAGEAMRVAFLVWPPVLLIVFSLLAVAVARRLNHRISPSPAMQVSLLIGMAVTMVIGVLEFAPGRIDHHNVQIVAMLTICLGLLRWDRLGGALLGAGCAVSVVVGLECLPFVVLAYAGVVAAYVVGVPGTRALLSASAVTILLVTIVCAAAFLGPAAFSIQCDAFSAPYILLMAGGSLVVLGVVAFIEEARPAALKIVAFLVPGAVLLGMTAMLFPACLDGPYAMIDPVSRAGWFDRIWQEKSFIFFFRNLQHDLVVNLALQGIMLAVAIPFSFAGRSDRYTAALITLGIAAAAYALTLYVTRYLRFPAVLLHIFLPVAATCFLAGGFRLARIAAGILAGLVVAAFSLVYMLAKPIEWSFDAIDYMAFDECKGGDFSVLATVSPGRIAAPQGVALPLAKAMPDGFSVAAVPFHRAAPGMKRIFEAFTTHDQQVRRDALAPFDYVAVCRFPLAPEAGDSPFYATLAGGEDWPGLMRIGGGGDFQLFRIDHAALQ